MCNLVTEMSMTYIGSVIYMPVSVTKMFNLVNATSMICIPSVILYALICHLDV